MPEAPEHHDVLVIGGGNAGISLAARLRRDGLRDVAVVESRPVHRYRPLLNYVGAGEASMSDLERPAGDVLPEGCTSIRDEVVSVDAEGRGVLLGSGRRIGCTTLVVCPGLDEDWDATPGLEDAYAAGWAASTFDDTTAARVWPALRDLRAGRVLFTVPPEPAPCGATALKPLFMACDHWRRTGVLGDLDVHLVLPGPTPLGLAGPDARLEQVLTSYGVQVHRGTRVSQLRDGKVTLAASTASRRPRRRPRRRGSRCWRTWCSPTSCRTTGPPAGSSTPGSPGTTRPGSSTSTRRPCGTAGSPTSGRWATWPTCRPGRPVGRCASRPPCSPPTSWRPAKGGPLEHYDGYTVMPITTSRHRLMLVEVDREGRPQPSVPFPDLTRPRALTWWVDRYVLPQVYWRRILRGKV